MPRSLLPNRKRDSNFGKWSINNFLNSDFRRWMLVLQLLVIAGSKLTVPWLILKLALFYRTHALLESAIRVHIFRSLGTKDPNLEATEVTTTCSLEISPILPLGTNPVLNAHKYLYHPILSLVSSTAALEPEVISYKTNDIFHSLWVVDLISDNFKSLTDF